MKPWWLLTQNRLGFWFPNLKSLASIPPSNYYTVVPPPNYPSLAHPLSITPSNSRIIPPSKSPFVAHPLSIVSIINSCTVPHPLSFVTSLTLVVYSVAVKSLSLWCCPSIRCKAILTQVKTFPSLNIHFSIDCKWNELPLILERTICEGGGSRHLTEHRG